MHRAKKMPSEASAYTLGAIPSSSEHTWRAGKHQGNVGSHVGTAPKQGAKDTKVCQVDSPTPQKDDKIGRQLVTGAYPKTSGATKPAVSTRKLSRTVIQPNRHCKEVSNDIDLLVRIVVFSLGKLAKRLKETWLETSSIKWQPFLCPRWPDSAPTQNLISLNNLKVINDPRSHSVTSKNKRTKKKCQALNKPKETLKRRKNFLPLQEQSKEEATSMHLQ